MKLRPRRHTLYIQPSDNDVLRAFINKNSYNRADARRIKKQLRKLAFL